MYGIPDEDRLAEYREEAAIDWALRDGRWGICYWCGDPTPVKDEEDRWCCKPCQRMMDDPGD